MIPSFMITFREGLEAFLIIGIILAYLSQTKRTELNKHVYAATGLAVLGSIGAALVFNALAIEFAGMITISPVSAVIVLPPIVNSLKIQHLTFTTQ